MFPIFPFYVRAEGDSNSIDFPAGPELLQLRRRALELVTISEAGCGVARLLLTQHSHSSIFRSGQDVST